MQRALNVKRYDVGAGARSNQRRCTINFHGAASGRHPVLRKDHNGTSRPHRPDQPFYRVIALDTEFRAVNTMPQQAT